jgi:integrase
VALNEGLRRKKALWRPAGRNELESLNLAPWASRRRRDLLDSLDQLTPKIQDLTRQLEQEVERRPVTRRLMTHPGVGPLTALAYELVIGTPERFHCGKHLSRNTIRNALCVIRGLFNYAIEEGIVESNPAARLGRFTRSAKTPETKGIALTSTEVKQFLKAAQEICPDYHPLLLLAVRAGLRRGELVALQWGDVQLGNEDNDCERFILVRHNYVRREHTTTKSKKSRRVETNVCWRRTWRGRTTFRTTSFFDHPKGRFSTLTTSTIAYSFPCWPRRAFGKFAYTIFDILSDRSCSRLVPRLSTSKNRWGTARSK